MITIGHSPPQRRRASRELATGRARRAGASPRTRPRPPWHRRRRTPDRRSRPAGRTPRPAASPRACASASPAGTSRLIRPTASRRLAGTRAPVSAISIARWYGIRRGSRNSPPAPATRPRLTSGRPNTASSLATTRSQDRTISNPPARAYPSTAAMTGLAGGRWVMPPKPRPPAAEFSPAAKPLRSIPAQKVPPAPVMISEVTSLRVSNSSMCAAMLRATASLTALRASGRLIVMMPMPSATSAKTASATSLPPWRSRERCTRRAVSPRRGRAPGLLWLESDAAVEADDLGVHVVVLDQRPDELGELGRGAHALGEHDRGGEPGLELLAGRPGAVDGGVDDPRADGVHPHPDGREVTCGRHGHPDDPALGRRVGQLAGLPLDAGYRGCVDDHAALAVGIHRLGAGDRRRPDAHQVERADQVDVDHLAEGGERVRGSVAVDGALGPADARAVHDHAQRRPQARGHV